MKSYDNIVFFFLINLSFAALGLRCGARASHCFGFSCCGARGLGSRALERRLSSCGARAQLLCGMWDLPGPGLEPVSPALAGGFLTTTPPGTPPNNIVFFKCFVSNQRSEVIIPFRITFLLTFQRISCVYILEDILCVCVCLFCTYTFMYTLQGKKSLLNKMSAKKNRL